ncbi:MAG: hypothetical protein ACI8XB_003031 [Patiriisocius sp.]|jgi:hypothetical protein
MKSQLLIIGLLIILIPSIGYSQNQTIKDKIKATQPEYSARKQINNLKNGSLLIRLKTSKKSISGLKKMGKDAAAQKVENDQRSANMEIISTFRENFDFCPVHFFFSDFSQEVKDKQFEKVVFLNDSLQPDSTTLSDPDNYLIAEFGTIEQDTAIYIDGYHLKRENGKVKKQTNYYGGADMRFGALIIKSDQFIQLKRPFPFYIRTFDSLPLKRKKGELLAC